MSENSKNRLGKITQIIGAVLDIKFSAGNLPEIYEAVNIKTKTGVLVVEVSQHLGDDTVRCIAMGSRSNRCSYNRSCRRQYFGTYVQCTWRSYR